MTKTPLTEYLKHNSQGALASAIGYYQSAISNMVKARRNIFVVLYDNGCIELLEEKTIGASSCCCWKKKPSGKKTGR